MDEKIRDHQSGIDGVILSPELLTALFADVLVPLPFSAAGEIAGKEPKPPQSGDSGSTRATTLTTLGENRRNICLLVCTPGKEILPKKTLVFLEKMLRACRLGIEDLVIVNTALSPVSARELIQRFSPSTWLIAGISPASIGMEVENRPFEVLSWQGSQVFLMPPLAAVDLDTPAARNGKQELWAGLQKLFGL